MLSSYVSFTEINSFLKTYIHTYTKRITDTILGDRIFPGKFKTSALFAL